MIISSYLIRQRGDQHPAPSIIEGFSLHKECSIDFHFLNEDENVSEENE